MDVREARQLANRGSLSGAAIGGAMFGAGMVLARGCSSRLLVLAAQGNLRALLSGLVFCRHRAVGVDGLAGRRCGKPWPAGRRWKVVPRVTCWPSPAGAYRRLAVWCRLDGCRAGLGLAASRLRFWGWFGAIGVGVMVAAAWLLTFRISRPPSTW